MKIQCRTINACALFHNFIWQEISTDPIEIEVGEDVGGTQETKSDLDETITYMDMTNAWSQFGENLVHEICNNWKDNRNA